MKPYPWWEYRTFVRMESLAAGPFKKLSVILRALAFLLSPIGLLVWAVGHFRFHHVNDNWRLRGTVILGLGFVTGYIGVKAGAAHVYGDLIRAVAPSDSTQTTGSAVTAWMINGTLFALAPAGLATLLTSARTEYHGRAYLKAPKPTLRTRLRTKKNIDSIRAGRVPLGELTYGVIAGDPLPWREDRVGQMVSKPNSQIGHGMITGASGTGKTIIGLALADQWVEQGAAVVAPDYKGSADTATVLAAIAKKHDVPFIGFSIVKGGAMYDPLAWTGEPSEKRSLLMESFEFGDNAYYRAAAESWLQLQFEVLDAVGLQPGEGTFDFLDSTTTKRKLIERVSGLRSGTEKQQKLFTMFVARAEVEDDVRLTGLRTNVSNIVHSAVGPFLRPGIDGDEYPTIDLRAIAERGGVVHLSLPTQADSVTALTIGALVLKDISKLSSERDEAGAAAQQRDLVVLVDEASKLRNRAEKMNELLQAGRSGRVWVWSIQQSLATWDEAVRRELLGNAQTWIVFRVQDQVTAELLCSGAGEGPYLSQSRDVNVRFRAMGHAEVAQSGGGRDSITTAPRLTYDTIMKLPNHHAYVIAAGSDADELKRDRRRRVTRSDDWGADVPMVRVVPSEAVLNPASVLDQTEVAGVAAAADTDSLTERVDEAEQAASGDGAEWGSDTPVIDTGAPADAGNGVLLPPPAALNPPADWATAGTGASAPAWLDAADPGPEEAPFPDPIEESFFGEPAGSSGAVDAASFPDPVGAASPPAGGQSAEGTAVAGAVESRKSAQKFFDDDWD